VIAYDRPMRRVVAGLALVATAACAVPHTVTVRGSTLRASIAARRLHGHTELEGTHWRDGRRVGATKVTIDRDAWVSVDGGRVRLAELEAGCSDTPPASPAPPLWPWAQDRGCPLAGFADAEFEIERYQTRSFAVSNDVGASLIGFGLVAIGGCALKCPEDSTARAVSVGTAATMGALLGLAITWALIDCLFVSGLGSPGCRD